LKTSPSWGEVPFLCRKNLEAQGFRLMQKAHLKKTTTFRKANKNKIHLCSNSFQLADQLNKQSVIVLLDDFFGSGNSAVEFYHTHLKPVLMTETYQNICLLSVAAQKDSINYIRRHIPDCKVFSAIIRDKAFSKSGSPFGYRKSSVRIREMCYKYGKGLNIIKKKDWPLGYRNSQALTVFSYSTPNNTLPILWSTRKNWYPLFPRSSEPRMNMAKAFRKDTAHMLSIAKSIGFKEFASGIGNNDWKTYQFITRSDFLKFAIIRLKNLRRADHIICQMLGITQRDYEQLMKSLSESGILQDDGKLSLYGMELYYRMSKQINDFKKTQSSIKITNEKIRTEQATLYLPKTFRGKH
jgi:hypothetical protein